MERAFILDASFHIPWGTGQDNLENFRILRVQTSASTILHPTLSFPHSPEWMLPTEKKRTQMREVLRVIVEILNSFA